MSPAPEDLLRALWATAHALSAMSKRMEHELGVTAPQRLVLRVIGQHPDISAGEVAAAVGLHPSTITGILKRLEDRGHVLRTGDPADRRRALFRLTRSGEALDALREGTVEAVVTEVTRDTPRERLEPIVRSLHLLSTALIRAAGQVSPTASED